MTSLVWVAGATAVVACGGDDSNQVVSTPDAAVDATAARDASPADTGTRDGSLIDSGTADGGDAGDAGEGGVIVEVLNDDQIVQVLHTANQGEVTEGTLAETSAVTATIQSLATEFVQMHSMADALLLSTAGDAGLTAAPSSTATMLQTQAAADQTALRATSGVALDELYYAVQLRTHQTVLSIIDNLLLTQVMSPTLKVQVQAAQTMVAMHLQQLQALEQGDAGTFDAGDGGDASDGAP